MSMIKKIIAVILFVTMLVGPAATIMAGEWRQNDRGRWYDFGDGSCPANGWHWLDGDGDGIAERYCIDPYGYVLLDTVTPDGERVDEQGRWIVDGVVQKGTTTAMERAELIEYTVALGAQQHNYYKGISQDKIDQAELTARVIAREILDTPAFDTDYKRINAAAEVVAFHCQYSEYYSDADNYYRSPYGVFHGRIFTCAGSTRALGRILDYMGYTWEHAFENQNSHQWCIVTIDGQVGWADGMAGTIGYGDALDSTTGLPSRGFWIF